MKFLQSAGKLFSWPNVCHRSTAPFLRVETANAHMHVAWAALLEPAADRPRPTLERAAAVDRGRASTTRRASAAGSASRRPGWASRSGSTTTTSRSSATSPCSATPTIAPTSGGSPRSAIARCPSRSTAPARSGASTWRRSSADGRVGLVAKFHHALVDGRSAVEVALLLFDVTPDAEPAPASAGGRSRSRGRRALALDALAGGAAESLRAARGVARIAGAPRAGGARIYDTHAPRGADRRRRPPAAGAAVVPQRPDRARSARWCASAPPFDDVQGDQARRRRDRQRRLPRGGRRGAARDGARARRVAARAAGDGAGVACATDAERRARQPHLARLRRPADPARLARRPARQGPRRHDRVQALGQARGGRRRVRRARAAARRRCAPARADGRLEARSTTSPSRTSRARGSRSTCSARELQGAWPVVPLAEDHALSIGIFSYRDHLHFGLYADPEALPDVGALPARSVAARAAAQRARAEPRSGRGRYADELLRSTSSASRRSPAAPSNA